MEKEELWKMSMGVVRTTYLIDKQNIIILKANDKVKLTDDLEKCYEIKLFPRIILYSLYQIR